MSVQNLTLDEVGVCLEDLLVVCLRMLVQIHLFVALHAMKIDLRELFGLHLEDVTKCHVNRVREVVERLRQLLQLEVDLAYFERHVERGIHLECLLEEFDGQVEPALILVNEAELFRCQLLMLFITQTSREHLLSND